MSMGEYMLEQKVKLICGAGKSQGIGELAVKMERRKALLHGCRDPYPRGGFPEGERRGMYCIRRGRT